MAEPFTTIKTLPFCPEAGTPSGYDVCPESFTLAEIMEWFWNSEDYIGGSFTYNLVKVEDETTPRRFEVHFDPDGGPGGGSSDVGLQIDGIPTRDLEPIDRVCAEGISMQYNVFRALGEGGNFNFLETRNLYMEIIYNGEDDYQIAVNAPDGQHTGTATYVAGIREADDEATFALPMPNGKTLSIPWATSHSSDPEERQMLFDTVTDPSSLEFYTYT